MRSYEPVAAAPDAALETSVASISEAVPYALISNTVELIPTLGALFPRGGPIQNPVLKVATTLMPHGFTRGTLSRVIKVNFWHEF